MSLLSDVPPRPVETRPGRAFPSMGSIGTATEATRRRWYVAAESPEVHHAKEVGTLTSACGALASSWVKFLDRPFDPRDARSCHDCAQRAVPRR